MPTSNSAPRKPHNFQERGVEWLLTHGGAGLFADPGCGKTSIVLRALLALKDAGIGARTLIVAPLRVIYKVWPTEAAEWQGSVWERLADLKIVVLHGPQKEYRLEQKADIYVINFDGLKWLFEDGRYEKFNKLNIDTLVIDESTKFKNRDTKRFKMLKHLLHRFKRRWIMTGTPTPKGYLDLFPQIFIIDLGHALGRFITHYRFEYFTPLDKMGWQWALKKGGKERIEAKVAPYIFLLDANDYLELPEFVPNTVRVDLPEEARRVYDRLEEDLIAELESGKKVIAVSSGVAAMKCAQVANGGIYTNVEHDWENLHEAKVDAVEEIVDELRGSPCLVVYDFLHDLARLRKRFPHALWIGGGVSAKRSNEIIDKWNRDELEILLVHPLTISHGLNMQLGSAHTIIWHSLTHDFEAYEQLNRRLRRQGSTQKRIFVHHIVATATVDEAKMRNLKRKDRTQQGFLKALKEYTQARQNGLSKSSFNE